MFVRDVLETQANLIRLGFDVGPAGADGWFGPRTAAALDRLIEQTKLNTAMSWGAKLTEAERGRVRMMVANLALPHWFASFFMADMAFETGGTFSPSIKNPRSTATGLIQFMEATAKGLGTSTAALARMTVIEQLEYVERHFKPNAKRMKNLGDTYMAILWPAGVGKPDDYVLWDKQVTSQRKMYDANRELDADGDGKIRRIEAYYKIMNRYVNGFLPPLVSVK